MLSSYGLIKSSEALHGLKFEAGWRVGKMLFSNPVEVAATNVQLEKGLGGRPGIKKESSLNF